MHEHEHKHECVHYCSCCDKVYCCNCKKEWGGYQYYYTYPWVSTPDPSYMDVPSCGTTTVSGDTFTKVESSCSHNH